MAALRSLSDIIDLITLNGFRVLAIEHEGVLHLCLFNNSLLSLYAIRIRDKHWKKAVMAYCRV